MALLKNMIPDEVKVRLHTMSEASSIPVASVLTLLINDAWARRQATGSWLPAPAAPLATTPARGAAAATTKSAPAPNPETAPPARRYWEPLPTNPDGSKKHASTYKSELAKAQQAEGRYRAWLVQIPDQLRHQFRYDPASRSLIANPGLEDWLTRTARHPRTQGGHDYVQSQWLEDNGYGHLREMPLPEYIERFRTTDVGVRAWETIVAANGLASIADIPAEGWPTATWTPIWNVDRTHVLRREGEAWPAGDPRLEGVRIWDDDEMERVRRGEPVA